MVKASRSLARDMLIKIFIFGFTITVILYYLLDPIHERWFIYTVQNMVSSLVAGIVVGFLLPKIPSSAVGSFAAFATIAGTVMYLILYHTILVEFELLNLYTDFSLNVIAAATSGFVGGMIGSKLKRLWY